MIGPKLYETPGWDPKKEKRNLQEKEILLRDKDAILTVFQTRIITLGIKLQDGSISEKDVGHIMNLAGRVTKNYYIDGGKRINPQLDENTLVTALKEIQQFNLLTEQYI